MELSGEGTKRYLRAGMREMRKEKRTTTERGRRRPLMKVLMRDKMRDLVLRRGEERLQSGRRFWVAVEEGFSASAS